MSLRFVHFALLFTVLGLVACGSDGRGRGRGRPGDDAGLGSDGQVVGEDGQVGGDDGATPRGGELRLAPADEERVLGTEESVTIEYQAFLVHEDGSEREVTADTDFWLAHPSLGSFSGSTFTSTPNRGGITRVFGAYDRARGDTSLTISVERVVLGEGAPADAEAQFEEAEADGTLAPELIYPNDDALVPPNLNLLEFHFRPSGTDLYEMVFDSPAIDLRVYFRCPEEVSGGCIYTPSAEVWETVALGARGQATTYTLRALDTSSGRFGAVAERRLRFARDNITGGVYYWNAGAGSIRRYDFGLRGQSAENFLDARSAGASQCVGCHSVSRDGSKIAVGMDIPGPATLKVFDVATRDAAFTSGGGAFPGSGDGGANFFSFSPDASRIAVSKGTGISVLDASDGSMVDGLADEGNMPDWSPDGSRIVFARSSMSPCFGGFCAPEPGVTSARIDTLEFDGSMWSMGSTLVERDGDNNFYPTFSPDGEWVLYNRSPSDMTSFPDNSEMSAPDLDFELWVVPASGGTPIRLDTADAEGDSWPKWDPTEYEYDGHPLFWFTFTSRRPYGLRIPEGGRPQLWMSAFDPTAASSGSDPSQPAFWLPFQELDSGNHIGQWVTTIERQPCTVDGECGEGEFCTEGVCTPRDINPI
jgi:hypothetical protein